MKDEAGDPTLASRVDRLAAEFQSFAAAVGPLLPRPESPPPASARNVDPAQARAVLGRIDALLAVDDIAAHLDNFALEEALAAIRSAVAERGLVHFDANEAKRDD